MFPIDPEKLINAIKARPSLYDRNDKMYYANKKQNHKEMMWFEVAEEVHGNKDLSFQDRINLVSEVQKRWRSLRSCFARELAIQRREGMKKVDESGYIKRRKKYEYFDSMLFLKREENSEKNDTNSENCLTEVKCTNEHVYFYTDNDEDIKGIKTESPYSHYEIEETKRVIFEKTDNIVQKSIATVKKKRDDQDEDQQFALSIVPSLRKLDSKSKLEAKIGILKAIQTVAYSHE